MQFGIGVIGATGFIGTPYRQEIRDSHDDVRIVALCARRQDRLEQARAEDGAELITDDWRQVVAHPSVNLVLVLTPDALHMDPVMACAQQRKHLLCEKPLGADASQAHTMWQAVQAAGIGHFVPYWTRYVASFQRARKLVHEGRLGEIRAFVYRWHNPRPISMPFTWRDDAALSAAGSIADVGSHAYDTLRYILGQEAKRVLASTGVIMPAKPDLGNIDLSEALTWGEENQAALGPTRKGSVPDFGQVILEYSSGLVGSMTVSHAGYLRKGFAPELELHGTLGSLSVDRLKGELHFADSPNPACQLETVTDNGIGNRFQQYVFPGIRDHIAGTISSHPGMEDGWRVQVFTDAVVASAKRGGWVELREIEKI